MVANQTELGSEETEYSRTTYSNFKGPWIKNPGFLFLKQGKMTDTKQKRQVEFLRQHTLTESDLRKMIGEKLERARAWNNALKKREALQERR
jgi:hypothetical protein